MPTIQIKSPARRKKGSQAHRVPPDNTHAHAHCTARVARVKSISIKHDRPNKPPYCPMPPIRLRRGRKAECMRPRCAAGTAAARRQGAPRFPTCSRRTLFRGKIRRDKGARRRRGTRAALVFFKATRRASKEPRARQQRARVPAGFVESYIRYIHSTRFPCVMTAVCLRIHEVSWQPFERVLTPFLENSATLRSKSQLRGFGCVYESHFDVMGGETKSVRWVFSDMMNRMRVGILAGKLMEQQYWLVKSGFYVQTYCYPFVGQRLVQFAKQDRKTFCVQTSATSNCKNRYGNKIEKNNCRKNTFLRQH